MPHNYLFFVKFKKNTFKFNMFTKDFQIKLSATCLFLIQNIRKFQFRKVSVSFIHRDHNVGSYLQVKVIRGVQRSGFQVLLHIAVAGL